MPMDFLSFGQLFLEVVFGHVDGLPVPGEEVFVDDFAFSCGGSVTTAASAARAGARAGVCCRLGEDLGSRLAESYCTANGVDLTPSVRTPGASAGITVVLNYDTDRAFLSYMPPRPAGEPAETERWSAVLAEHRPAWCYLHAGPGIEELMAQAHAQGTRVALDVNYGEIDENPDEVVRCARLADLFVPNEGELARLTKEDDFGRALHQASSWCSLVVVKRGPAGAVAAHEGQVLEVPEGVGPVEVKDMTGAGDAFVGALVGNLVAGADLRSAVRAGNVAGSTAVGHLGATGDLSRFMGEMMSHLASCKGDAR